MTTAGVLFERSGTAVVPTEHAVGPWSDGRLHGGAVAGLLAELLTSAAAAGQSVASFRAELLGAVPSERFEVRSRCVRRGRRLSVWETELTSQNRVHARASAMLAAPDGGGPDAMLPAPRHGPDDGTTPAPHVTRSSPFFEGIDFRVVQGTIGAAGPASVWARVAHRWFDDCEPSGLARLAGVADVAYGFGLPIEGDEWLAMNLDVGIHLAHQPRGEWILLDATTELGPTGLGVGHAEVADRTGRVGRVTQSVILRRGRP